MKAYRMKITVGGTQPPVWLRAVVPAGLSFARLSAVFCQIMGWNGQKTFGFDFPGQGFEVREGEQEGEDSSAEIASADNSMDFCMAEGVRFVYWYGLETPRRLRIEVEKILPDYGRDCPAVLKWKGDPELSADLNQINRELKKMFSESVQEKEGDPDKRRQSLDRISEFLKDPELARLFQEMQQRRQAAPNTLEAIFSCYEKEEIAGIAREHGLADFSGLGKERMIRYVRGRILDPDMMRRYFRYMTDREIKAFREAVKKGSYRADTAYLSFNYAGSGGYVGFRSRSDVIVPEDVCAAFRKMDTPEFEKERKRTRGILNCLNASAGLYGICPVNVAIELYGANTQDFFEAAEAEEIWEECPASRKNFILEASMLFLPELEEETTYQTFLRMQGDLSYSMAEAPVVEFIGEYGYLPFDSGWMGLLVFLTGLPGEDQNSAFELCREIQYHLRFGSTVEEIPALLEQAKMQITESQTEILLQKLTAAWAHTRLAVYRGHTPEELGLTESENGAEKIVSFEQRRKTRIYPNDPCPCGSGKKYKNCCGRKNLISD